MGGVIADVREMLKEQVEYRELLRQMTTRDLLIRYKQAIMGFGWAVFMPLVNTAVFSIIFAGIARSRRRYRIPCSHSADCGRGISSRRHCASVWSRSRAMRTS